MFNNKRRIHSAWARGLMFGKVAGASDERERVLEIINNWQAPVNAGTYTVEEAKAALILAVEGKRWRSKND